METCFSLNNFSYTLCIQNESDLMLNHSIYSTPIYCMFTLKLTESFKLKNEFIITQYWFIIPQKRQRSKLSTKIDIVESLTLTGPRLTADHEPWAIIPSLLHKCQPGRMRFSQTGGWTLNPPVYLNINKTAGAEKERREARSLRKWFPRQLWRNFRKTYAWLSSSVRSIV